MTDIFKDGMTPETINQVIAFLRREQDIEPDPVQNARIGEAVWTLQDLRRKIEGSLPK